MPSSQGNILLADDEETFLEATQDLLQEEGYDCHTVRNAEELSQALQEASNFDVLITDLNMPGNRVLEMVREIRSQITELPVIVVTGYPSVPSAVESIHLHVLEYLIKPVDYTALLAAIRQGLQQKQVLRSVQQARKEATMRVERMVKIEEILRSCGPMIPLSEFEEVLNMNPRSKQSTDQTPGSPTDLEPCSSSLHASPLTQTDYFYLREAVFETIQVLQKTKSAFRSKDLANLRKKLESVLAQTKDFPKPPPAPTE